MNITVEPMCGMVALATTGAPGQIAYLFIPLTQVKEIADKIVACAEGITKENEEAERRRAIGWAIEFMA